LLPVSAARAAAARHARQRRARRRRAPDLQRRIGRCCNSVKPITRAKNTATQNGIAMPRKVQSTTAHSPLPASTVRRTLLNGMVCNR